MKPAAGLWRSRALLLSAAVALLACDSTSCLLLYAAEHSSHRLPSWSAWEDELWAGTSCSDLVLLLGLRCLANALAPYAFPRTPATASSYESAVEELAALWPDTWRLLSRESAAVCVWALSGSSLLYCLLVAYKQLSRGAGSRQTALLALSFFASAASIALVAACRRAARRERLFRSSGRAGSEAACEAGLAEPLLPEEALAAAEEAEEAAEVDEARSTAVRRTRLLFRLATLSRPDYGKLGGAFVFLVAAVVCDVAIPAFKADALSAILAAPSRPGGGLISPAFTRALVRLAVASLGAGVFAGLRGGLLSVCNVRLVRRLQQALFGRLIRLDMASLDAQATGKLLSRLTTDTALVGDVLGLNVNVALRSLLRLLLTVAYLGTLDVPLTLVSLTSALTFFGVSFVFSRYQRVSSKAAQEATAESNHVAEQTLSLARTVRAFSAEAWEEARFERVLLQRQAVQEKQAYAYALYTISFGVLDNAQSIFLLLSGGSLFATGRVVRCSAPAGICCAARY